MVFLYHREIINEIEKNCGFQITRIGVTTDTKEFPNQLFRVGLYDSPPGEKIEEYNYSIPYTQDACVLVSRKSDSFKSIQNIQNSRYVGYPADDIIRSWLVTNKISTENAPRLLIKDALGLLIRNDADYMIIPLRLCEGALKEYGYINEIYVSRPIYYVQYRIAVPEKDKITFIRVNNAIYKLLQNGTLSKLASRNKVKEYNFSEKPFSIFLVTILISFIFGCIVASLIYIQISFVKRRAKRNYINGKLQRMETKYKTSQKQLLSIENSNKMLSESFTNLNTYLRELQITDPYSGLFTEQYLFKRIKNEINQCNITGITFCLVRLKFCDARSITLENVLFIKENLSLDLQHGCICSYNGFGEFLMLFPQRQKDIIDEYIESLVSKINNTVGEKLVYSTIFEYAEEGQIDFLESLERKI